MIRFHKLEPCFVLAIPQTLKPGVLYVSMEYGTVVHSCCCGCGLEVITPLTPTDWKLSYDGEGVSLWPSVGNWNFPCQSHYVITGNCVIESGKWSNDQIEAEQRRDQKAKTAYYELMDGSGPESEQGQITAPLSPAAAPTQRSWRRWWRELSMRW